MQLGLRRAPDADGHATLLEGFRIDHAVFNTQCPPPTPANPLPPLFLSKRLPFSHSLSVNFLVLIISMCFFFFFLFLPFFALFLFFSCCVPPPSSLFSNSFTPGRHNWVAAPSRWDPHYCSVCSDAIAWVSDSGVRCQVGRMALNSGTKPSVNTRRRCQHT